MSSIPHLPAALKEQYPVINNLAEKGWNNLENLWTGHLLESGMYDKVAYMLTEEKVYPNLHPEMVWHHMENAKSTLIK